MRLTRTQFRPDGIFGRIYNDNGVPQAYTLEHSYAQDDGTWAPKLPVGTFKCVLGQHQLEGMAKPFETYEITGVPGHTNILIHMGNFDKNSEGCVLVGQAIITQADGSQMVTNSVHTFDDFMLAMRQTPTFSLIVTNEVPHVVE